MACPYNDPICSGVSGLFLGVLACWPCYRDASQRAVDHFQAVAR